MFLGAFELEQCSISTAYVPVLVPACFILYLDVELGDWIISVLQCLLDVKALFNCAQ